MRSGSKQLIVLPQVIFGFLGIPVFFFHGYMMVNQVYVLRVENALNIMALAIHSLELLLGAAQALLFLPSARIDQVSLTEVLSLHGKFGN